MAKKPTATTEVESPPVEKGKPAVAADHVPPVISGSDLMASFRQQSEVMRQRRLAKLALKHPEIAAMLKSKIKTPTAEAPRIES